MNASHCALYALLLLSGATIAADLPTIQSSSDFAIAAGSSSAAATVVDRRIALDANCRMIRALDGRAVCASPRSRQTVPVAQAARPGAAADSSSVDAAGPSLSQDAAFLLPGRYLVIGSFAQEANARRWADYNAEFGTVVQLIDAATGSRFRVMIGPLRDNGEATLLPEILDTVGIGQVWPVDICGHPPAGTNAPVDCGADRDDPRFAYSGQP